ncbi:MAG: hypothetical protein N2109_12395 [Fimbriimonadales bacterium]|nr:hypothetical protein [Fimbriimonadales bacterium]
MSAVPYVRSGVVRPKARARAAARSWAGAASWATAWCFVCLGSVLLTNFLGNVALERCRLEARQTQARLDGARRSLARLQSGAAALSAPQYLADWARERGFVEPRPEVAAATPRDERAYVVARR